jgi:uncharacterized protein (DUF1697 family)
MEDQYVINEEIIKDTISSVLSHKKKLKLINQDLEKLSFKFSNETGLIDMIERLLGILENRKKAHGGGDDPFHDMNEYFSQTKLKELINESRLGQILNIENYLSRLIDEYKGN